MKKFISLIIITLVVAGSSCKKTYLSELALNPDKPGVTSANLQLSAALTTTASLTSGTNSVEYLLWANYYSYSTNYQASPSLLLYAITQSSFDSFTPLYANISNYNAILGATSEPYYTAIAHIMLAYDFQRLVDQYNNVPYTAALQGIAALSPAYDTGSSIYDNLLAQLDAAILLIKNAPVTALTPGKYDIMFGATSAAGMAKWMQFANTLKLRLAIRQSSNQTVWNAKKAALIASIQSTSALGYLSSTAFPVVAGTTPAVSSAPVEGAINPGYSSTDPYESVLDAYYGYKATNSFAGSGAVYQANQYAVNFFLAGGTQTPAPASQPTAAPDVPVDPRLYQIYAPSKTAGENGAVVATYLGQTSPPQLNGKTVTPSIFSGFMISPTRSTPIMLGSEAWFLQAEANLIGLLPGGAALAQTDYQNGIANSFIEDFTGVTPNPYPGIAPLPQVLTASAALALAVTYYTNVAPFPIGGTFAQQQQAIITQKWAALDPFEPLEAYCEILRTGYPAVPLSIASGAVTSNGYVERMQYPLSEYNYNTANVNAQGTITSYAPKIFWEP